MPKKTLKEIAQAAQGRLIGLGGRKPGGVRAISIDSRTLKRGDLYCAIVGERLDGHDFVGKAFAAGASAALISDPILMIRYPEKPFILVEDTLVALQNLAAAHRRSFRKLTVVAITGSNGKTSVKEMIAAALSEKYQVLKTEGNLNNHIGLPLTLLKLTTKHQMAVVEMGMSGPGEIAALTRIARPDIGVITNVGSAHAGAFKSVAGLRAAKGELIEASPAKCVILLNGDDKNSRPLANAHTRTIYTVGRSPRCSIRCESVQTLADGRRCASLSGFTGKAVITAPLPGERQLQNSLMAYGVARLMGVPPAAIQAGLAKVKPGPGRMEPISFDEKRLLINDAYNASPESVAAAIETIGDMNRGGAAILVLGDMLELGARAAAAHRAIGVLAARNGIDRLIALGPLAREAARAARQKGIKTKIAHSHDEAAATLVRTFRPGDTALVKGSRGMRMERVIELYRTLREGA